MNDDPSKLIPELHEAIRLKPKLAATQVGFHLAVALARSGNVSGAISTIRKAIEQGPQFRLDTPHLIWPIALIDQKKDLSRSYANSAKERKKTKPLLYGSIARFFSPSGSWRWAHGSRRSSTEQAEAMFIRGCAVIGGSTPWIPHSGPWPLM